MAARKPEGQRHLQPVEEQAPRYITLDSQTGEKLPEHPEIHELNLQLEGAQAEIRGWRTRYGNLKRDKDREARQDARWPLAKEVFDYWRRRCAHPRAKFDADRFHLIAPFLDRYGIELCQRAIDGAAYDPFTKRMKNGAVRRYDGLDLIFRNADKFEDFCNRAPRKPKEET